jgi:uncharacterized protein
MKRDLFSVIFCLLFMMVFIGQISADTIAGNIPANYTLNKTLFSMPDTRQSTEYSCGAAALQAVVGYWGRDIGEEDMREMLNTNPESGTYPDDIIRVAQEMGLNATYKENLTLADLETYLGEGVPVIVDCQAWRSVSQANESWADDWGDGHWVVVIGMDDKFVYLEDPYILGSQGIMTRQEFGVRWHNWRGLGESDTTKQIHMGIAIRGERAAGSQDFRHVD